MRGKRIVVTRASHQAEELAGLLRKRGAEALSYPCIAIAPPNEMLLLDNALRDLAAGSFDWLVITSANTAPLLRQRQASLNVALPTNLALACVGSATASAAEHYLGLHACAIPEEYVAEALVEVIKPALPARVLLLQAEKARPVLREALASAGATVSAVTAYRTMMGEGGVHLSTLLKQGQVDAVTFTSASTVRNCVRRLAIEQADSSLLIDICLACIGPVTAQALNAMGLSAQVMPAEHTLEGLVEGLDRYFCSRPSARRRSS